jgi:hypothetical protein
LYVVSLTIGQGGGKGREITPLNNPTAIWLLISEAL